MTQLALGDVYEERFDTSEEAKAWFAEQFNRLWRSDEYEYFWHSIDYVDAMHRVQIAYLEK